MLVKSLARVCETTLELELLSGNQRNQKGKEGRKVGKNGDSMSPILLFRFFFISKSLRHRHYSCMFWQILIASPCILYDNILAPMTTALGSIPIDFTQTWAGTGFTFHGRGHMQCQKQK